jgi:hypothetical protein
MTIRAPKAGLVASVAAGYLPMGGRVSYLGGATARSRPSFAAEFRNLRAAVGSLIVWV